MDGEWRLPSTGQGPWKVDGGSLRADVSRAVNLSTGAKIGVEGAVLGSPRLLAGLGVQTEGRHEGEP